MENLNLVLNLTMAGGHDSCIRAAARIKVDGKGGLKVYDAESAQVENIELAALQSLSIQYLNWARRAA